MKLCRLFFVFLIITFLLINGCVTKTPLIIATESGNSSAVQQLIKQGANINEPDSNGVTPLMHAIWSGNADVIKQLIELGADIKAKDKNGYNALLHAIDYADYKIVKLLLDKGADINSKDNKEVTALMRAVYNAKPDIAKHLIELGVDANAKDNQKYDALIYAVDNGDYELTELLLDKGANVNSKDFTNTTPIMHASHKTDNKKLVSLLIKRGANLDEKDDEGYTALGYALFVRNMAIADEIKKALALSNEGLPTAKVVFLKEAELLTREQDVFIYIDDKMVVNLYNENTTDSIDVKPGKFTMVVKGGNLEGDYVKSFDAVVGQTYYFEVSRRVGNLIAGVAGGLVGVVVERAIQGDEAGIFKITQLEESLAKEKIKAINEKRK